MMVYLKRFLPFFVKCCYFREEHRSMLRYHAANYDAKIIQIGNVCEDIENNNTRDKDSTLDEKCDVIYYSSNSKGIFAQVRCINKHILLIKCTTYRRNYL